MPEILVLRQPDDEVYDRILVEESEVASQVSELYEELKPRSTEVAKYSLEVLYDTSPRSEQ